MAKGLFRKMHGLSDKELLGAVSTQAMNQHQHARVINHHGRMLMLVIALGLTEAVAVVYVAYLLLWTGR